MPIQRPSEREQRPSALDVFTDREELIAAFERNLAPKQPQDNRVRVFYGDGGRGRDNVSAVFGLHVIAYNLIRLSNILMPAMVVA